MVYNPFQCVCYRDMSRRVCVWSCISGVSKGQYSHDLLWRRLHKAGCGRRNHRLHLLLWTTSFSSVWRCAYSRQHLRRRKHFQIFCSKLWTDPPLCEQPITFCLKDPPQPSRNANQLQNDSADSRDKPKPLYYELYQHQYAWSQTANVPIYSIKKLPSRTNVVLALGFVWLGFSPGLDLGLARGYQFTL